MPTSAPPSLSTNGSETIVHESPPIPSLPSAEDATRQHSITPSALSLPRRRRSCIARLPKTTRDQINQMLDDGCPYAAIAEQLGQQGIELSDDCVARWKKGGYQDYLRELRLLDDSRVRYELTLNLARDQQGIDAFQAAHKIAAAQICDAVAEIGADSLRQAIKLNPLNFLRALNALCRLTAGGLKCERHVSEQAEHDARLRKQQQPEPKKGISPETLKMMQDALNLM